MTVFTVGYADKTLTEILKLMAKNEITLLVDVRSVPFSRKPEFNRPALERALGKRYVWDGTRLGGLREREEHREDYYEGLESIAEKGKTQNICVMCMEKDPDQCHRKQWIAADLLQRFGVECQHL